MKFLLPATMGILLILAGCCSSSSPSSPSYCTTYGEACTNLCSQMEMGEGCFTECMDAVSSEGLGDATTCCKYTFRQYCDSMCTDLEHSTEGDTPKSECMEFCRDTMAVSGLPFDSCYLPL